MNNKNSDKDNQYINENEPNEIKDKRKSNFSGIIEDEDFDLMKIWKIFKRRKKIFLISILFSSSIIFFYFLYQRIIYPVYKGSFKILVSDPISKSEKFMFNDLSSNPEGVFDFIARNTDIISNDLPTLIEFLKSESILKEVSSELKINYKTLQKNLIVKISDHDKRIFDSPPNVLDVSYKHRNRKKGLNILSKISESYLKASIDLRQKRLSDGLSFLNIQAPQLEKNTREIQEKIQLFREKYSLVDPSQEALTLKNRINDLEKKIFKLSSEKERLLIIKNEIKKGNLVSEGLEINENEGNITGGTGLFVTDSNKSILKELNELKKIYAEYLTKYLPSSELVLGIKERIDYLEPIVLEKQLESVNSAIDLKQSIISSSIERKNKLNNDFLKQPKYISEFQNLETKLKLAKEKEDALVKARQNFKLEIMQRNIPWTIISQPNFSNKVLEPSEKNYLFYGLLLSLFLGTLIILLQDKIENIFYDSEEIKRNIQLNFIFNLPFLKNFNNKDYSISESLEFLINSNFSEKKSNFFDGNENSELFIYKESINNLFISLSTIIPKADLKFLSITSSIFGEGKTLIISIIAKIFSDNGYKVLLIDADLRKPSIHNSFSIDNKNGLTNLLLDSKLDPKKYIQEVNNYLSIITSGPIKNNPLNTLESEKVANLFKNLKESNNYDLVIFDVPPILGISDYKQIVKYCDHLLFLISIGYCRKNLAFNALKQLKESKFNLTGIITNSINPKYSTEDNNPNFQFYMNLDS